MYLISFVSYIANTLLDQQVISPGFVVRFLDEGLTSALRMVCISDQLILTEGTPLTFSTIQTHLFTVVLQFVLVEDETAVLTLLNEMALGTLSKHVLRIFLSLDYFHTVAAFCKHHTVLNIVVVQDGLMLGEFRPL
jgi:hypothetical protein